MTSFRSEETEEQKVHYDLSEVTQPFNDRVIQKFPFIFIMRFRDAQNAMFNYQEKMVGMSLSLNDSDQAHLLLFFSFFN